MIAPIKVAWISDFPIEWLSDIPAELQRSRQHPLTWQRVLLQELENDVSIELHVIVLRKHLNKRFSFKRGNVNFHLLKTIGGMRAPSLYWSDTLLIRSMLRKIQPDIIHAWGTERGAALVAARLSYPCLVTMQGLMSWLTEVSNMSLHEKFAARMERWSLKRAFSVSAESKFAVTYLKSRFPHLEIQQIEHAPDPLFFQVQRCPPEKIRFIYVGTLCHHKGTDVLLAALDILKQELDFELVLVGKPRPEFCEIFEFYISASHLGSRIRHVENLTSSEVAKELSAATMMVFPARADNSPNAVKEAVVAGVPIVASSVGGILDYVVPGKNGVLHVPNDVEACVGAIRYALSHREFRSGIVDTETLRTMRIYLSSQRMKQSFLQLYRNLHRRE